MQEWILLNQKNPFLHYIFQTANLYSASQTCCFLYEKSLCCSAHLLTVENKKLPRSNSSKKQQNSGEQDKYKFHQGIQCKGFTYKYTNVICEGQSKMENLIDQLDQSQTRADGAANYKCRCNHPQTGNHNHS